MTYGYAQMSLPVLQGQRTKNERNQQQRQTEVSQATNVIGNRFCMSSSIIPSANGDDLDGDVNGDVGSHNIAMSLNVDNNLLITHSYAAPVTTSSNLEKVVILSGAMISGSILVRSTYDLPDTLTSYF